MTQPDHLPAIEHLGNQLAECRLALVKQERIIAALLRNVGELSAAGAATPRSGGLFIATTGERLTTRMAQIISTRALSTNNSEGEKMADDNQTAIATMPTEPAAPPTKPQGITLDQLALFPDSERRNMWINSLVETDVARRNYAQDRALAADFVACGQFDDLKALSPTQAVALAMVKIQLGRGWGFSPADSMRYIYFTNGRPAVENDIVASKLQQAGFDWDAEFDFETVQVKGRPWQKCVGCTLVLKKWDAQQRRYLPLLSRKGDPVTESFGLADAENAKYYEKGVVKPLSEKFNYQSWPKEMFYWRTIGRVRKFHAPHVLRGGTTFEERLDVVSDEAPPDLQPTLSPPPPQVQPEPERPARARLRDLLMPQGSFVEGVELEDEPEQ